MAARKKATKKKPQASKTKRSTRKPSTPDVQKDSCFVIMPFGGWFDDYYSAIFSPAIEAAGLESRRADGLYRPSTIVSDIWSYTREAKLILADLSGKNPNVFYELGLAHALAKPAILVVESMDDIPFDLRALRVLEYDKNAPDWGTVLQEKIEHAIDEVLAAPHESVPAAFLEARPTRPTTTLTAQDKEMLEIRQELDLLRRQVRDRPSRPSSSIPPHEARELIERYVRRGMSTSVILRLMEDKIIPQSWILKTVDMLREKPEVLSSAAAGQASASDAPPSVISDSTSASPGQKKATKKRVAKKKAKSKKRGAKKNA